MNFLRFNLTIRPPLEIQNKTMQLSKEIAEKEDVYFTLDNLNFFPHITIYSPEFPVENRMTVIQRIAEIAAKTKPFEIKVDKLFVHNGYIDFQIIKDNNWMQLHEQIIELINPLRNNHLRIKFKDPEYLNKLSNEQKFYIEKYGYPDVLNLYRPHITITRLKEETNALDLLSKLEFKPFSFNVDNLTIFTMGEHGTCTGIVKEFIL